MHMRNPLAPCVIKGVNKEKQFFFSFVFLSLRMRIALNCQALDWKRITCGRFGSWSVSDALAAWLTGSQCDWHFCFPERCRAPLPSTRCD
jgi:hypothetical protein